MPAFPGDRFHRALLILALVLAGGVTGWAVQNREMLAAACLNTVNGLSSKFAHLNQPFGLGTTVESRNPVVGMVPAFTLNERNGGTVAREDLLGSYWVASFIFTRCATSCPMVVSELVKLQDDLPSEVRLVSFSVDPEHDSPEVLAGYANGVGAQAGRWLFLTGNRDEIYKQIREGFLLAVEENSNPRSGWEVTHSPRFALVDPQARIRGYYESSNPDDLKRLRDDVRRLLARDAPES